MNCKLRKKKSKDRSLPVLASAPLCHLRDDIFINHESRHELIQDELRTLPPVVIDAPTLKKNLSSAGFEPAHVDVAMELARFLHEKKSMGALMSEIYERFPSMSTSTVSSSSSSSSSSSIPNLIP